MQKQSFMRADEVAQELGISKSHAYKVIHGLNKELQEKGYLTISGRVNKHSHCLPDLCVDSHTHCLPHSKTAETALVPLRKIN